jgi:hypothetical protein
MHPYHTRGDGPLEDLQDRQIIAGSEDPDRQQIIAFHEERLNWRLQRAFEDCFPGRAFQQPRPVRPRPVAAKPQGFA